ncbi:MAG: flagellin [Hyphomonas sp.]|nr:flagellin [Hyphomonas sp.]MDP3458206.1 flagellin [Hyphomonas sp.]
MRIAPPNSLISAQFTQNISDLRQSIARTAQEATTGRHSDLTAHLSGRVGSAMLSQKALDDIGFQREQLSQREARLDLTQRSLTMIHDRALGIDISMQQALGSGNLANQGLAARDAKAALTDVFSALNVRFGERYLFAGDATATLPLPNPDDLLADIRQMAGASADPAAFAASLDAYFNTPGGGWQQDIYGGTATASDPDAVTGADPALVALISSLAVLAISDPADSPSLITQNPGMVNTAAQALTSGLTALTNLRADRGVAQEQLTRQKESLDIEETIFTSAFNALTARDQYEAASALKQLESTLEASYLLTSRLSSLSLLNYLR